MALPLRSIRNSCLLGWLLDEQCCTMATTRWPLLAAAPNWLSPNFQVQSSGRKRFTSFLVAERNAFQRDATALEAFILLRLNQFVRR